jgi:hypothetical protein
MSARRSIMLLFAIMIAAHSHAGDAKKTPSALETDPKGWLDLMPTKDLKGWRRVPLPPEEPLAKKNPWRLAADGKTLICDGVGIKEMFLHDKEFGDGILHVEWRFKKSDKEGCNSGVYVRTHRDGTFWHQAQVAHQGKAPDVGDFFGVTMKGGKLEKFQVTGTGTKHAKPVGEWNTYEVTCKGKTVSVWLNGFTVTTWDDCPVPRGHVGLQAEYFDIEFRNLKFKE